MRVHKWLTIKLEINNANRVRRYSASYRTIPIIQCLDSVFVTLLSKRKAASTGTIDIY